MRTGSRRKALSTNEGRLRLERGALFDDWTRGLTIASPVSKVVGSETSPETEDLMLAGMMLVIVAAICLPETAALPALPALSLDDTADSPEVAVDYTFDSADDASLFTATAKGEGTRYKSKPKIHDGKLSLLESWSKFFTTVAFSAPAEGLTRVVEARFALIMNTGTEGAGFVWLDADLYGEEGKAPGITEWEAPSMDGCFSVGFDASNPPNRDPFRGSGNIYDRPQHEISLHWDGMEIVKKTTPMDFRDEKPHAVRIKVEYVAGGGAVSVFIDDTAIFEEYFIPSLIAYRGRPAFGARNGETAGDVLIDDLSIVCREPIEPFAPPVELVAIDHKINDAKHPRNEAEVDFPEDVSGFGRIVCTLRLDKPETRFDPWDRTATICVFDDEGERFEIIRYITPYHNGHVWKVDVTDFAPLLQGRRKIEQACGTQGEGWVVTVKFDFYSGEAKRRPCRVINLWSGSPEIGNPDKPASDFYVPREIAVDKGITRAKVRFVVTGHGMSPNTNNAAEFMPLGRTLTVNGASFHNVLWKTDNYLNPCRPQGGTWKYDRAGWAPGDVVRPWEVDVSHLIDSKQTLEIEYILDEYVNEDRGKTWAPTHKTEAHLVLYRGK